MPKIRIKNWSSFQHYKERRPPWIKLHRELLDNYEFHCLPIASRALAPMLWLLAAESADGSIDHDPKMISFRLRMTEVELNQGLQPLIDSGFVNVEQDAGKALAACKQDPMPETEGEAEEKTEAEEHDPNPDEVAIAVCTELMLTGANNRRIVSETVPVIAKKLGLSNKRIAEHVISEWRAYQASDSTFKLKFYNWVADGKWNTNSTAVQPRKVISPSQAQAMALARCQ